MIVSHSLRNVSEGRTSLYRLREDKLAWKVANVDITLSYKKLMLLLILNDERGFFVDNIVEADVDKSYTKLRRNLNNFMEIHKSYTKLQNSLENCEQMSKAVAIADVKDEVCKCTKIYEQYKRLFHVKSLQNNSTSPL